MLPIQLLHPAAKIPCKSHPADAGFDCFSPTNITLTPLSVTKVPLGFALELPETEPVYCQIAARSGLAYRGIWPVGGVVDPGYRGELIALLYNSTADSFTIQVGDRVCQLLFLLFAQTQLVEVPLLKPSTRGSKGLGSTGGLSSQQQHPQSPPYSGGILLS